MADEREKRKRKKNVGQVRTVKVNKRYSQDNNNNNNNNNKLALHTPLTDPMPPRPRRAAAAKSVDYSQFVDVDAVDDDADVDADVIINDEPDHDSAEEEINDAVDEVDDDGDVAMTIDLDEEVEEKKPKKRGRPSKPKVKTAPKKKDAAAKKDAKNPRTLSSLKDKFIRCFGNNEEKLIELLKYRKDWEAEFFQFDESKLNNTPSSPVASIPTIETKTLTRVEFGRKFPLQREEITLQFGNDDAQLLKLGTQTTKDTTHIIHDGMLITDMAWMPQLEDSTDQYLAISISNIVDTTISPKFSLLAKNAYTSGFRIYKLDTTTGKIDLHSTIIHDWGNSWDLKWIRSQTSSFGTLCAVFNDGNARLLQLPDTLGNYIEITKASLEYSIPDQQISAIDISGDILVCGTNTGHIAEFTLNDPIPSYLYPVHYCYIFSLSLSSSPYDEVVVYTSCSDGTTAMTSLTDPTTSIVRSGKSKSMNRTTGYSPQLHSFILVEDINSVKATPIRAEHVSGTLCSHDGSTECIATSKIHPLMLSGGSDGRIKINSIARRMLNGQKVAFSTHKVMTLFELQYGKLEDTYRLVQNLHVEGPGAFENTGYMNLYPSQVAFGSLAWNENKAAGKWFAAATTSGLLFVDRL